MNDHTKITQSESSESILPAGVSFIRGVYWVLVSSEFVIMLAKVLGTESGKKVSWVEILLGAVVNLAILLGIYRNKSWVVPLVLINASLRLLYQILQLFGGTAIIDPKILTQKFTHLLFGAFCIYQIFVFTKRETKAYFQWKGQTIV